MPYIEESRRPVLDEIVRQMIEAEVKGDGDLNYILYKFGLVSVKPSYNNYKNYLGELRECESELRRRLLAPYEDSAKERNGDVEVEIKPLGMFN